MGSYTEDGGVISNKVPMGQKDAQERFRMFGLYRGVVLRTVYPEDPENTNKNRVEYVIKVGGQEYKGARNLHDGGGVYNYEERIRKHTEKSFKNKLAKSSYDEDLDGEVVYVMFLEGHGNVPVIVGSAEHSKHAQYSKPKRSDGIFDVEEFNGVEFMVDKDSNYTIKHVGRKDPNEKIQNTAAVDSTITMHGNGDIEFNTHGTGGTSDLGMKFTKEDKKVRLHAQNNIATMDADGVVIQDKNSNIIKMESGKVTFTIAGDAKMDASGKAEVVAGGDATLTAGGNVGLTAAGALNMAANGGTSTMTGSGGVNVGSSGSVTKVDGSVVLLAGGGVPVARLGDLAIGVGNLGAPVLSVIAQGSPKVTSG